MAGEPIISRFSEFVERRTARDFYIATGFMISTGVSLDLFGVDGVWTPRFGALASILIAFCYFNELRQNEAWWRWLRGVMDDEIQEAQEPIVDAKYAARMNKARGVPEEATRRLTSEAFLKTRPAVEAARKKYWQRFSEARHALGAQGKCIAMGALVWAFGDIPINLLNCGGLVCPV